MIDGTRNQASNVKEDSKSKLWKPGYVSGRKGKEEKHEQAYWQTSVLLLSALGRF